MDNTKKRVSFPAVSYVDEYTGEVDIMFPDLPLKILKGGSREEVIKLAEKQLLEWMESDFRTLRDYPIAKYICREGEQKHPIVVYVNKKRIYANKAKQEAQAKLKEEANISGDTN